MAIVLRTPATGFRRYYSPRRHARFALVAPAGATGSGSRAAEELPWSPTVVVRRQEGGYTFTVDFRDVNPEDIEVNVTSGHLEISGVRRREKRIERDGYKWHEVSTGTFTRQLELPGGCDWEKAEAVNEDGFLRVTVPDAPVIEPRKIPIEDAKS